MAIQLIKKSKLLDFYKWFIGSGLDLTMTNNVGDPFDTRNRHVNTNSHTFEREVIEKMCSLYGFDPDDCWGLITFSRTDGNNHAIYFGSNYLMNKTGKRPGGDLAHIVVMQHVTKESLKEFINDLLNSKN